MSALTYPFSSCSCSTSCSCSRSSLNYHPSLPSFVLSPTPHSFAYHSCYPFSPALSSPLSSYPSTTLFLHHFYPPLPFPISPHPCSLSHSPVSLPPCPSPHFLSISLLSPPLTTFTLPSHLSSSLSLLN